MYMSAHLERFSLPALITDWPARSHLVLRPETANCTARRTASKVSIESISLQAYVPLLFSFISIPSPLSSLDRLLRTSIYPAPLELLCQTSTKASYD